MENKKINRLEIFRYSKEELKGIKSELDKLEDIEQNLTKNYGLTISELLNSFTLLRKIYK